MIQVSDSWHFDSYLSFLWLSLDILIHLPRWADASGYHGSSLLFIGLQHDVWFIWLCWFSLMNTHIPFVFLSVYLTYPDKLKASEYRLSTFKES